ncbi:MAG: hypothetical protein LBL06_01285 [Treponema sp.]|jgi:hypothetical protein|nr:hypothetical protein [Treponema sp.]
MKKLFLFGLVLFLGSSSLVFAREQKEKRRGLYVDVGFGLGDMGYFNGDTKATADHFNETTDTRATVDLQFLTVGRALTQSMYLVGTMSTVGDGYFDAQMNQSQITIIMWGVGARYYPLPSKKYLQLGLDVGINRMDILYDQDHQYDSDAGFSGRVSAAYDFDKTMTGFTGLLGGALTMNIIENDRNLLCALFFKVAFK